MHLGLIYAATGVLSVMFTKGRDKINNAIIRSFHSEHDELSYKVSATLKKCTD